VLELFADVGMFIIHDLDDLIGMLEVELGAIEFAMLSRLLCLDLLKLGRYGGFLLTRVKQLEERCRGGLEACSRKLTSFSCWPVRWRFCC
jgi:hypothetical protein